MAVTLCAIAGCKSSGSGGGAPAAPSGWNADTRVIPSGASNLTPQQVGSLVMGFSDTFTMRVAQACDELAARPDATPDVRRWAVQTKIAQMIASLTTATGPNPVVNLLDMTVLVTLKRVAIQEHAIPKVIGLRGASILETYRKCEAEIWEIASKVLTAAQVEELRGLIERWRKDNPEQHYVGFIRFADFGVYRQEAAGAAARVVPGSVFSLLLIDPLAGLDPVAREMYAVRQLIERLAYLTPRLPLAVVWHAEQAAQQVIVSADMPQFVKNSGVFADASVQFAAATTQFAQTAMNYPKDLAREREAAVVQLAAATAVERDAAIRQASAAVDAQRAAFVKDIEQQDQRVAKVMADARMTLEEVRRAAADINASTTGTIAAARAGTREVILWVAAASLAIIAALAVAIIYTVRGVSRARRVVATEPPREPEATGVKRRLHERVPPG